MSHRARLAAAASGLALGFGLSPALAANEIFSDFNVLLLAGAGLAAAVAAAAWAVRASIAAKSQSVVWSSRLAELEARIEKSDAVLSAHPGLVLVWEDDNSALEKGWGAPKILGGPAALASLMSLSKGPEMGASPIDRLLETLGDLPVEDDSPPEETKKLKDKVRELRAHGIAFSGAIVTAEGRAIDADGRVAGGQVALWLTDPAVRMAEDGGVVGKVRERTTDLHGALMQLERAPVPAWRRGADLSLVWVNRAYAEAVEAPNAAFALKGQIELDPAARKIAETATQERRPAEGRVIVNMRGERRVLRVVETPMHGADGASLGGVAIDVTELDRARTDLKRHIEANRRTLDQVPTAVALFGPAQTLSYHNAAFARLWGFDEAELAAAPAHGELLDRLRQDDRLPILPDYAKWKAEQLALYTAQTPGEEADAAAPDEVWHLPSGRTLRVARARHPLGGVLMAFEDVTEKLDLEARYNTQIGVQRASLNNLAEGLAVFARDGTLRLWNAAFQRLWRLDQTLLDERPRIDRLFAVMTERAPQAVESFDDLKRRATSFSPEDRTPADIASLFLADGRVFAAGSAPLPDGATLVRFLDVTDTREREKELKERNAFLEDIDRQKTKFVNHVSYQLRTPLATIVGFAEMLDGQMFGVLNDRQKDYIASILTAAHHLRDLITDVIDLAVIDAGKMTLERAEIDVRALLENAATYAALKAEDTQVALKMNCARDIGVVAADEKRLKQVLFNLLSNAFAYTGAGGEVELGADRAPGLLRLWVADTGRGVSAEDQAKAFDPFESRGPSAGAGIGLTLVQRFIALHGGWVRLESEPGKGTRVTCFLPCEIAAETTPDAAADAPQADDAAPKKRAPARRKPKAARPLAHAAE